MRKLKLYFDTSAIGVLDEQTSPAEMGDMQALWKRIKQGEFDVVLSRVTLDEIYAIGNEDKLNTLINYLAEITYETIEIDSEVERIAALVKTNQLLISDKHQGDRLHIGCAIVSNSDILVSYNFRHLANVRTIKGVRGITNLAGYKYIEIMPAAMLIADMPEEG